LDTQSRVEWSISGTHLLGLSLLSPSYAGQHIRQRIFSIRLCPLPALSISPQHTQAPQVVFPFPSPIRGPTHHLVGSSIFARYESFVPSI